MALARLSEINVSTEGVMGAKDFFEAKVRPYWLGSTGRGLVSALIYSPHNNVQSLMMTSLLGL